MRFSFVLFGHPPEHCSPIVQRAEVLGFDAVWFGDHVLTPEKHQSAYPYRPSAGYHPSTPLGDVWSLIAHASAATSTITLGPNVYVLPLRHPAVAAQSALTVQNLSGGRLVFGVGTGWLREEFDQLGVPFAGRGRRLDEALSIVQLLWTGEAISFVGESFQLHEVRLGGRVCAPIPIAIGGASEPALRRAARHDAWHGPELMLHDNMRHRDTLRQLRDEAELDPDALRLYVKPLEPLDRDVVRRYADAGFDDLVVSFGHLEANGEARSLEQSLARLDALMETVN